MDRFQCNEKYLSRIPARQLWVNLGFACLAPAKRISDADGAPAQLAGNDNAAAL
jgi:hypothetical protein